MSEKWNDFKGDVKAAVEWLSAMSENLKKLESWAYYQDSPRWRNQMNKLYVLQQKCLRHYKNMLDSLCPCREATNAPPDTYPCESCPLKDYLHA